MTNDSKHYYAICDEDIDISWVPVVVEMLLGIGGNALALILLWTTRREHKWNSFYKLFTGLALTDLIGVLIVYPIATSRYVSHFQFCFPRQLCQFLSFVFVNAHISGAFIICAMSIDRYINLTRPELFDGRKYSLVLVGIWVFSSLFSMLHLIGVGDSALLYPGSWCYLDFLNSSTGNRVMAYLYSILGFIIVAVTIIVNSITCVRLLNDPIQRGMLLDLNEVSAAHDSHVIVFIVAVTVVFCLLWTPLLIIVFLHAIGTRRGDNSVELWVLRLAVLNAVVDPLLYIILRKESLQRIIGFFNRCRKRICNEDGSKEEKEGLNPRGDITPPCGNSSNNISHDNRDG